MLTVRRHDPQVALHDPIAQRIRLASQRISAKDAPTGRWRRKLVVREYQPLTGLTEDEQRDLERFAFTQSADSQSQGQPVAVLRNGRLYVQNYVGIIETRQGTVIEILPKVDLSKSETDPRRAIRGSDEQSDGPTHEVTAQEEATRQIFLTMLRDWRGLRQAELDNTAIRAIRRFDMLEAFVHLFLTSVIQLTRRGLARSYRTREENLPRLRGRILFPPHLRENLVDRSRFYVGFDEFTADRPENRLIHLALRRLGTVVRHPMNRQQIHQLRIVFSGVPPSTNLDDDWARHRVDRSMRHYDTVMPWVGLFLFGQGFATFSGPYVNRALLFPMEEVFEDFVTAAVRRHQRRFTVRAQGPMTHLARDSAGKPVFRLKPDIALIERDQVRFILDSKWKRLASNESNHGISQADVYQLFAYGMQYGCRRVVLVYPKTTMFSEAIQFRFLNKELTLDCFPFDVTDPKGAVSAIMHNLLL